MPVRQLTNKPPTANSKGLRFGNFVQGREVIEEELEAVFAGKKDAKPALDDAVQARQRDPAQVRGRQQVSSKSSSSVEKRVVFRSAWLPYALVAPQIAITIVFFFWPAVAGGLVLVPAAGRLRRCSTAVRRPGRTSPRCSRTSNYLALVQGHGGLQRRWSPAAASPISLLLATMADRVIRGALAYKTLLIWPYAVAPAVAGVLWAFLFAPSIGIVTYALRSARHRLELGAATATRRCCWW